MHPDPHMEPTFVPKGHKIGNGETMRGGCEAPGAMVRQLQGGALC